MTTKQSGEPRADLDDDKNRQNGASIDSQSNPLKGAINSEGDFKCRGNIESDELEMELAALRHKSFDLATDAASVLDSKEDWCVKDFDTVVGTYLKIITAKTKIGGGEDEIERLIGMFSAMEESQSSSVDSKGDADESC